jgi:hypothetical protein
VTYSSSHLENIKWCDLYRVTVPSSFIPCMSIYWRVHALMAVSANVDPADTSAYRSIIRPQEPLGSHFALKMEAVRISETSAIQPTYSHRKRIHMSRLLFSSPRSKYYTFQNINKAFSICHPRQEENFSWYRCWFMNNATVHPRVQYIDEHQSKACVLARGRSHIPLFIKVPYPRRRCSLECSC